jgi:hypothetical protein
MVGWEHHLPPRAKKAAAALFGLLLGLYLITSSGHFYAVDEEMMFNVTESLSLHGSFALNPGQLDGSTRYSQYGPGQSIAAVPLYWLGSAVAALFPPVIYPWLIRAIVGWFNPIVTAGVAALLYLAVLLLGFRHRIAIVTALLYGLGTMAWPQSKTFFAEPLTALLFFGSFILLLAAAQRDEPWLPFLLSGLLAGRAPAVKIQAGIALPLLSLFALLQTLRLRARPDRVAVVPLAAWLAGAALPLGLLGLYQLTAFGSPLRTGYGGTVWNQFTTPFWVGFNGQIWSSGRGIIWYAPPLLLFPIGVLLLWRRHWPTAALCALMFIAHVLFYAKWSAWDGAGAWGPRFLNAILPFMAVPLAAFLDTFRGRRATLRNGALIILTLLAVPVQLGGLLISVNTFFSRTRALDLSYYRLADSAIVWHLRIAADQLRQSYDIHFAPESVALLSGFSYSEGGQAQVPRWTLPQAVIGVRPPKGDVLQLVIALNGCWSKPSPSPITIASANTMLVRNDTACPARTYHFALPTRSAKLTINALPWNPAAFGGERDETLGTLLQQITAQVDGQPLTLQGETLPVPPMPLNSYDIRHWMGDHRMSHWDFWWWYILHDRLSIGSNLLLAGIWLVVALGSCGWGLHQLARCSGESNDGSARNQSAP